MDGELKAQERALSRTLALKLLRQTCADSNWEISRILRIESVKHRPGRRLTVRYKVEARQCNGRLRKRTLYGKLYRGRKGERAYRILRLLRSLALPSVRFPEPLGYHPRKKFLLLDALEGPRLTDLLWSAEPHRPLSDFGRCLAALHAMPVGVAGLPASRPADLRRHGPQDEVSVLERARQRVMRATSLPSQLKERFQEAHARIGEVLVGTAPPSTSPSTSIIHRDLYPDQVIMLKGQVGLIDLDEVSLGEPANDAGNLVGHLMLADLQDVGVVGAALFLRRAFLDGYRDRLPLPVDRLALYTASSLLRLASLERISLPEVSILGRCPLADALVTEAERALDRPERLVEDAPLTRSLPR